MTDLFDFRPALLVSGGGTTMAKILEAVAVGSLPGVKPAAVIASRSDCGAIDKALTLGMPRRDVLVMDPRDFKGREAWGLALVDALLKRRANHVHQCGWIPLTPLCVINAFPGRMANQHPAPLDPGYPDFGGKGMRGKAAVAATLHFARLIKRPFFAEATAHVVAPELDKGALLKAVQVPIYLQDTVGSLQERLLPVEHATQIAVLRAFANGTARPYVRPERLIRDDELELLARAKARAIAEYPEG